MTTSLIGVIFFMAVAFFSAQLHIDKMGVDTKPKQEIVHQVDVDPFNDEGRW